MISYLEKRRHSLGFRMAAFFICLSFSTSLVIVPAPVQAQGVAVPAPSVLNLPPPGTVVPVSNAYQPALIKGLQIFPDNPLKFDFIVDRGESGLAEDELRKESTKLIKYFMASLTIPEKDLWVNLSPYEDSRIIPEKFSLTEMGRDLLAQDYMLKQLTASLMNPEEVLGSAFWQRVYAKSKALYGITDIPVNTFNKVWIVPENATVFENGEGAFIIDSHLKVMLEEDYFALQKNYDNAQFGINEVDQKEADELSDITTEVVREIFIPEIEKEVNTGKTFANLRQIFNSMILATWYKKTLKRSLLGQVYVDKTKIRGVDDVPEDVKLRIYDQYIEAFKKGVYNFIKEDYDPVSQQIIPRKYFSGGWTTVLTVENADGAATETVFADRMEVIDAAAAAVAPVEVREAMKIMARDLTAGADQGDVIRLTALLEEPLAEERLLDLVLSSEKYRNAVERNLNADTFAQIMDSPNNPPGFNVPVQRLFVSPLEDKQYLVIREADRQQLEEQGFSDWERQALSSSSSRDSAYGYEIVTAKEFLEKLPGIDVGDGAAISTDAAASSWEDELIEQLYEGTSGQRRQAADLLGYEGSTEKAVPALVAALNDQSETVRRAAVLALRARQDIIAIQPLINRLYVEDDPYVRNTIRRALDAFGVLTPELRKLVRKGPDAEGAADSVLIIVGSDRDNVDRLSRVAHSMGGIKTIREAYSPQEALEIARELRVRSRIAVISEFRFTGLDIDGVDLARTLEEEQISARVTISTREIINASHPDIGKFFPSKGFPGNITAVHDGRVSKTSQELILETITDASGTGSDLIRRHHFLRENKESELPFTADEYYTMQAGLKTSRSGRHTIVSTSYRDKREGRAAGDDRTIHTIIRVDSAGKEISIGSVMEEGITATDEADRILRRLGVADPSESASLTTEQVAEDFGWFESQIEGARVVRGKHTIGLTMPNGEGIIVTENLEERVWEVSVAFDRDGEIITRSMKSEPISAQKVVHQLTIREKPLEASDDEWDTLFDNTYKIAAEDIWLFMTPGLTIDRGREKFSISIPKLPFQAVEALSEGSLYWSELAGAAQNFSFEYVQADAAESSTYGNLDDIKGFLRAEMGKSNISEDRLTEALAQRMFNGLVNVSYPFSEFEKRLFEFQLERSGFTQEEIGLVVTEDFLDRFENFRRELDAKVVEQSNAQFAFVNAGGLPAIELNDQATWEEEEKKLVREVLGWLLKENFPALDRLREKIAGRPIKISKTERLMDLLAEARELADPDTRTARSKIIIGSFDPESYLQDSFVTDLIIMMIRKLYSFDAVTEDSSDEVDRQSRIESYDLAEQLIDELERREGENVRDFVRALRVSLQDDRGYLLNEYLGNIRSIGTLNRLIGGETAGDYSVQVLGAQFGLSLSEVEDQLRDRIGQIEYSQRRKTEGEPAQAADPVGGIDLNPILLDMQIKRDGDGVPLPMEFQDIQSMNIKGFVPVIINVTPVVNMPFLLGMTGSGLPQDIDNEKVKEKAVRKERLSKI